MYGRNGMDKFCNFLLIAAVVLFIAGRILGEIAGSILSSLAYVSIIYCYFRALSRNKYKRSQENFAFLHLKSKVTGNFGGIRTRFMQRKDYRFFRCPKCRAWQRVPRGKGKVSITCGSCRESFIRKT